MYVTTTINSLKTNRLFHFQLKFWESTECWFEPYSGQSNFFSRFGIRFLEKTLLRWISLPFTHDVYSFNFEIHLQNQFVNAIPMNQFFFNEWLLEVNNKKVLKFLFFSQSTKESTLLFFQNWITLIKFYASTKWEFEKLFLLTFFLYHS